MFDHLLLFGLLLFCAKLGLVWYAPLVCVLPSLRRAAEPAEQSKDMMGQDQNWAQRSHLTDHCTFLHLYFSLYNYCIAILYGC